MLMKRKRQIRLGGCGQKRSSKVASPQNYAYNYWQQLKMLFLPPIARLSLFAAIRAAVSFGRKG
nr:hypothetical protein [uncultured Celeribacter sp.]